MNKKDKSLKIENFVHVRLNRYLGTNYSIRKGHTKRL